MKKKELEKATDLKKYLSKKEELLDKTFAKMPTKRPKETKPFKRDKSCTDCKKSIEIFNENK